MCKTEGIITKWTVLQVVSRWSNASEKKECVQMHHRIWDGETLTVEKLRPRNVEWLHQSQTNSWTRSKTKTRLSVSQSRSVSPLPYCMPQKDTDRIFKGRIEKIWHVIRWGEWNRGSQFHLEPCVGVQNESPQKVHQWDGDDFELKAIKILQAKEKLLTLPYRI